jgi:hypothetical protein
MKFKSTLLLLGLFILLLAAVYFFELRDKGENTEDMLVSVSTDNVEKIIFQTDGQTIQFQRQDEEWLITDPVEAKADKYEVNRLADDFTNLRIERVVEEEPADLEKYGIPQKQVELYFSDREKPEKILIGSENPLDNTFFAKREEEMRVVLIPSSLKSLLEKGVFDFRQKNIFQFETDQVKRMKIDADGIHWEAEKDGEDWFLTKPVNALAQKSKISDILSDLSNLKATAFVSENKQEEGIRNLGLDDPDYKIEIDFPVDNKRVIFSIHQQDDKTHAVSSISPKILQVEDSILEDLKIEPGDLRDKEVADFFTWEVTKLKIRKGDISFSLAKDEEESWKFEEPELQEADKEKVQSFLRKLESLESQEFVDPPLDLSDLGLDSPQAEIKIWAGQQEDTPEELTIQIGKEDSESKTVFLKNHRFPYVFKVDSSFLEEFPERAEDWKVVSEEQNKEDKD